MTATILPHGLWPSELSPERLAESTRLGEAGWTPDGKLLLWQEEYAGEGALFASALDGNAPRQLTSGLNVKARVGYGGGAFAPGNDFVYFVAGEGRIHAQPLAGGAARPITPPGIRCASPALSPDGEWLLYVYEVEGENGLALVDAQGRQWPRRVAWGHDFYMHPAWRADGLQVAWVAWDHPHMPWDTTRLYIQPVEPGAGGPAFGEAVAIAGGDGVSVIQPNYAPRGNRLAYLSDEQDWYRLFVVEPGGEPSSARCVTPGEGDHGGPAWVQDMRWFDWADEGQTLAVIRSRNGEDSMLLASVEGGEDPRQLPEAGEYPSLTRPVCDWKNNRVALVCSSEKTPPRLAVLPLKTEPQPPPAILRRSAPEQTRQGYLPQVEAISWSSADGEKVHGLFARPAHPDCRGEGPPPLVVNVHSGPTAQASRSWKPEMLFFTSRGYAFLDVNHRGSSGYGRRYRDLLRGQWGVFDAADAISGAEHAARQGWVHPQRWAIRGSSAGGYTVLRVLTTSPRSFKAGICLYGISELFSLVRETHKFEAHYLDSLIAPLPQGAEIYRERSPINMADRICAPLLLFQGADDVVVPPAQSEAIAASLKARGIPCSYHLFQGEGHGFRRPDTIRTVWREIGGFLAEHLIYA
ncbi:MAG: S9 family peptidase [Deltaproteobacteria bacterium]|nr:S9 family peptidase [Deltaproteobacteria bacterium]